MGQAGAQGVRLELRVPQGCADSLGRLVLRADTATVSIPGAGGGPRTR